MAKFNENIYKKLHEDERMSLITMSLPVLQNMKSFRF